jgi:predicted O-methyltransferase YrrM
MDSYNLDDYSDYCENFTSPLSDVLINLDRETHLKTTQPRMLSGPLLGKYLEMISKMLQPKHILEVGTFTGFSAICLAQGLAPMGELTTIEVNPEREDMIRSFLAKANLSDKVNLVIGDALKILPTLEAMYDLIFIDAKKEDYGNYYDLIFDQWKPGGILIADNVLWSGKVLKPETDKTTASIIAFSEKIKNDPRVSQIMLPIRDGILMVRKNE